jgi:hypothetical protein
MVQKLLQHFKDEHVQVSQLQTTAHNKLNVLMEH